jgi:Na+-driven multidrug efflux pump
MSIYIFIYWLTSPIIGILLYYSSIFAVDNHPFLSTSMVLVSSIFKIIFMVISLFVIKIDDNELKMYLAALSTSFGALISFFIIIIYNKSKKRLLKFSFKIEKPLNYLKISIKAGLASILTYLLMALQLLVINSVIARALNDNEILIYGVICNMLFCVELFTAGIIQLIPALIGVLYGEEDYNSVLNLSKKMLIICEVISLIIVTIFLIYPKLLMNMFGFDTNISQDILNLGYNNIRIYSLMFIFNQINMFIITYYPTVGKSSVASLTVILRTTILSFI